jgi:hypothetical protein
MFPSALLRNKQDGKYYAVYFQPVFTFKRKDEGPVKKYVSRGHDSFGFHSPAAAEMYLKSVDGYWYSGVIIDWDPKDERERKSPRGFYWYFDTSQFDATGFDAGDEDG